MSVTALVFLAVYFSGIVLAVFKHPRFGLYAYLFAFYVHPPGAWWRDDVPDLRWALIAGLITLITTVRLASDQQKAPWYRTGGGAFIVAYVAWMVIQGLWAISPYHTEGVELYAKYIILFYLIYKLVDTEEEMRNFFLVHVIGCAYLGWLAYGKTFRGRLEGVGGPGIDDANTLGMHMSTAAVFGAALLLRGGRNVRLLVVAAMPLILNTVVLTGSRGAFVGLLAGGISVFFCKPAARKAVVYALGGLAVTLMIILSPPDFIARMQTITVAAENPAERDESADIRLELAKAQLRMFADHPLGVGHHGTRALAPAYLDESLLTANRHGGNGAELTRGSHNTLLAVMVDQGVIGLLIYGVMLLWAARTLIRLRRMDADGLPYNLAAYRMSLAGALTMIIVAGMFSNYIKAEITIWCLALLAALQAQGLAAVGAPLAARETSAPATAPGYAQQKNA